jgi:hypothetical protein
MEFKSNLYTVASDIQYFLLTGIKTLPITIAGTLLLIGMLTANYAMLFFLMGLFVIAPFVAFIVNTFGGLIESFLKGGDYDISTLKYGAENRNVCNVVTKWDGVDIGIVNKYDFASYWLMMTFFILGYLFTNAFEMYSIEPQYPDGAKRGPIDAKVIARQTQTAVAMTALVVLAILVIVIRLSSSCDGPVSLILGVVGGSALGYGWYVALASVGNQRLSDLFGIANRLMIPMALVDKPYACLPTV